MIQDRIVPTEEVDPAYFDRGLYFGDGIYEMVHAYNGKIFAMEKHLQRFANGLDAIGIKGVDIDQIRGRVEKALEASGLLDAGIYFQITRGSGPRRHTWDSSLEPNFFLFVIEWPNYTEAKAKGISVSTYPDLRWKRCDIKSLNLLPNVLAKQDAAEKGCYEAILVNEEGLISEGTVSAFFAIFGRKLRTTPLKANILPSITRGFVIKAAENVGMEIVEESVTPQEAVGADELFFASTGEDIVGIVKFDGNVIGDGRPGKYTKLLIEAFRSFTV